jgi:two-component system, LytTR family, sensor kinase
VDAVFTKICILVTAAFALTLLPGFKRSKGSLLAARNRGSALAVFLVLGLVEEASGGRSPWLNERIVTVCAAGLVAGPLIGLTVSVFVTWLAVSCDGLPLGSIGFSMLCGGLIGGWLHRWRPKIAERPLTGFCLTLTVSLLRDVLTLVYGIDVGQPSATFTRVAAAALVQGLGTALILAIVALVRNRDEQTQAAASAEVRALQARMNPHFLLDALNTLAALSTVAPREIPRAAGRLRHFLRASFDQHERELVPLSEELAVVHAYLDIESLQMDGRLRIEENLGPGLADVLTPPFSLQPLVENAVQHGLRTSPKPGRLRLLAGLAGEWLEMSVNDDGPGVSSSAVEQVFFPAGPRVHALPLLRRRLEKLFGRSFRLEVRSELGQGTQVTMRIPLLKRGEPAEQKCLLAKTVGRISGAPALNIPLPGSYGS